MATRMLRWLTYFVLLIPAIPPVLLPLFEPYTFGKMELFMIATEAMAFVWILARPLRSDEVRRGRISTEVGSQPRSDLNRGRISTEVGSQPRSDLNRDWALSGITESWIPQALLLFIASCAISTLLSDNPAQSFWGSGARGDGLFPLLHFVLFFFVARAIQPDLGLRLIRFSVLISFFTAWYGMAQLLGLPFVQNPLGAVFSTLGNPAFFAAYLAFHVFCALFLARRETESEWKTLWYAIAAFETAMIFLTGVLAVAIGLALGLFVAAYPLAAKLEVQRGLTSVEVRPRGALRSDLMGSWGYCAVGIVGVVVLWFSFIGPALETSSAQSRLFVWQKSVGIIAERPWFGHGARQFSVPAPQTGETFDKPHNIFLETLVSYGVMGLCAYLFAWYAALRAIQKKFAERKERCLWYGMGAAYAAFLFFFFETFAPSLAFFLLLAFLSEIQRGPTSVETRPQGSPRSDLVGTQRLGLGAGMLAFIALFFTFHYQPIYAAYFGAKFLQNAERTGAADERLKAKALRYDAYNSAYIKNAIEFRKW